MSNFNFEWLKTNDNFVGDLKIGKTMIGLSPTFEKNLGEKVAVLFSAPSSDQVILGFADEGAQPLGAKKSKLSMGVDGKLRCSLPSNLAERYRKGHYNAEYLGHEEGITAYRLTLINTSNGQVVKQ